ncbi:MAG: translation initiation factor IF-6 [Methanomassiliicoccales archaeon]|nr:MAG: translation initiation factor IF-6 [Methanomassiliicoccales archaeon]
MLKLSSYNGVEFVGVYAKANELLALAPNDAEKFFIDDVEESLGVEVKRSTIAGTNLLGSLIAMNSYGAVVTSMAMDSEVDMLSRKMNVARIEDRLNAAGNNILVNDNGAIVNPDVHEMTLKLIEETLQVEVVPSSIAGHKVVGSVCSATNKGVLCHPDTKRSELELIRSVLKVPSAIGTLNYGSPMVGASIIANSKGGVVGFRSTPIELGRVEDALVLY